MTLTNIAMKEPEGKTWVSMPYEIASGMVRTVAEHFKKLLDARVALHTNLQDDEEEKKKLQKSLASHMRTCWIRSCTW